MSGQIKASGSVTSLTLAGIGIAAKKRKEKGFFELSDEELEKVTGGTTYSGSNYYELGLYYYGDGQGLGNHPVITTIGNSCSLSTTSCYNCDCNAIAADIYGCS